MWSWLIAHTVGVLALAVLAVVLGRCLRLSPAARHALWLVVLLKLLAPPFLAWPWALPLLPARTAEPAAPPSPAEGAAPDREGPRPTAAHLSPPPGGAPADVLSSLPEEELEPAAPETATPAHEADVWGRLGDVAAAVWLCGGLAVALPQLRRLAAVRRLLAHAEPAPAWLDASVRELCSSLGVRPPRVQTLPGLGSPQVWAGGRTRLLWPRGLEERLTPDGCRAVLVHELAHLARRDHWVGRLLLVAGCVWWWHPLFYLVRRQLQRYAELACDAWVVATLPEARRSYAEALLDVCQRHPWAAAAVPALGATGRRRDLERRLVMIMRENVPTRLPLRVLGGICLLGLLALPAWTLGQVGPEKKATDRDGQLRDLEQKLRGVLKDLEEQRKAAPASATAVPGKEQPRSSAGSANSGAVPDRDKKLQELEKKVKELLKEVQTLRAGGAPQGEHIKHFRFTTQPDMLFRYELAAAEAGAAQAAPAEVTLSRTTYKLPAAKAEALGKFLQEHVKAVVMETKVEGDSLTVTTTPEVQRAVGQFIGLVQGKRPPPVDPRVK
jgi:beta-lactamase regulating signal transducer with metallopeptidase domain